MYCRCISLLFAAATLGGCGGPGLPEPESGPDADTALPATSRIQPQEAQLVREDFPFPVMPGWVERNGLHVDSLTRQALSSTWIHESDPAVQATAYRRMLERAGYRTGPGLLSGDVEMAFTGTGAIAGEPFHFGVGFLRGNHGDRMAYRVRSKKHLLEHIVPFFVKHPLKTKKNVDFQKFRRILLMMEKGVHLTGEGIEEIRAIAKQMNRGSLR